MQDALTIAAMLLSVASVGVAGWFSARTVRLSHELDAERERRREQRSALEAAGRVYEPLAQAPPSCSRGSTTSSRPAGSRRAARRC